MKKIIKIFSLLLVFMLSCTTVFAEGRVNQTLAELMVMASDGVRTNDNLTEDFEKGTIGSRFTTEGKVSLVEEDGNTSAVLNGANCSIKLDEDWSDFTLEFDVTIVSHGWASFKFRCQDDGSYYTVMMANLAHNQQFSMRKFIGAEANLSTLGKPMSLGQKYNIKLVAQKGRFELYVDGVIFITGFDEDITSGAIEFSTTSWSAPVVKLDNIKIQEIPRIPVESISTDTPDIELYVGEKLRLPMDIYPYNSYNTNVILVSDDETVVRAEDYSAIGVGAGTATIKCTTEDGGYSIKYNVTVKKRTFDDITDSWAKEYIEELAHRQMISGDGTGNYYPEDKLTRAEAVALAVKMVGYRLVSYKDTDNMPYVTEEGFGFSNRGIFDDVSSEDWYADMCQTAYTAGILDEGLYPDGSFVPNEYITREEAVTLFIRAYEKATGVEKEYASSENKDIEQVSDYAVRYINAAAALGVITDEYVRPKDKLTRAEAAAIECRVLNNIDEVGAIPVVPLEFEIDAPKPKQGIVVSVADFGAKPYDPEDPDAEKFDNFEAFTNAIAYCGEVDASKLIVPTGWYYFNTAGLLRFDNIKDLVFDGQGSTFVLGTVSNFFRLEGCDRVEFKNMTFDWDWDKERIADIIEVTARDSENKTLDIKYLSCDYVDEEDVQLKQCASIQPITYTVGDADGIEKMNIALSNVVRLSDNEFRVTYTNATLDERLRAGSLIRTVYMQYSGTTFIAYDTKNLTIDNLTIYSNVGIGFCFYNGMENWQIINSAITRRPGYELTHPISSSQDGVQVNNMSKNGHFRIENCNFGFMNDDCVNVHQNISVGIDLYEDDRYSVLAKKADWSKPIRAGERVGFLNPDFTDTGFEANVVDTVYMDNIGIKLILDKKVPQNLESNTIVVNRSFGSCWGIIRNNTFTGNYGRGLLVRGDNILIEGNKFSNISNSAIMTEIEITSQWVSGIPSSNLLFRNNEITACDENETKSVVRFTSNLASGYSPATHISKNIVFENNTFTNTIGKAFTFDWAENVTVRNNRFIGFEERKNVIENRGKVDITNSNNIKIYGNVYEKSEYIDSDANNMYTSDDNTSNIHSHDNIFQ